MEWEPCYVFLGERLIDGSYTSSALMRHRVRVEWQYRRPTAEEEGEEWSARQY